MTKPTPTVYLLEGADGTGKTTFAESITAYGGRIVHNDVPPKDVDLYELYLGQIVEALHRRDVEGETTVIDRSFLSEAVYGRYRGNPRISKSQRRKLERYCKRNGVVMLGFVTDANERHARILARGEKWTWTVAMAGIDYHDYFLGARARRFWITADSSSAHTL